ncbi:hypothetical protein GLOTRDRAFT_134332 [Gloeophyllum trabeum ATCC 11539]|uniref:Uncharacterized protein n=1 Tax=Gloeophyllum trabeum (strain ATCC 11539 / FP-39264 / Madison 617) TaxID=670483 RepID=S7PQE4_GLOTA|nr:uncharacterized protein GLOTRDRAFT_134332 [Gloeophyllum trabeum ATCC 11539]EPQ50026.1 hypothetical protein GLOTRDRAFT_134332 [Gloeophyllum trabeum ATCC 11539]
MPSDASSPSTLSSPSSDTGRSDGPPNTTTQDVPAYLVRRLDTGVYEHLEQAIEAMGKAALGFNDITTDFNLQDGQWNNGHQHYIDNNGNRFTANVPITDDTNIKNVLVIGEPGDAARFDKLHAFWHNQLVTLQDVGRFDEEREEDDKNNHDTRFRINNWLRPPRGDAREDRNLIALTISPAKYVKPDRKDKAVKTPFRLGLSKVKVECSDKASISSNGNNDDVIMQEDHDVPPSFPPDIKLGATYNPRLLPDYSRPLYQLKTARLTQPDIVDVNGKLIPPWLLHDKLRPGTLIVANVELVVWVFKKGKEISKTYQVVAHKIKVVDPSDAPAEIPAPGNLKPKPDAATPMTPSAQSKDHSTNS